MRVGVLALLISLFIAGALTGCESSGFELKPGATSIFQGFAPPSPTDAAKWAIDPYDADKRYRGTLLLANAPFANDPLYVQLFTDNAKDKDPGVRAVAARGLGTHGGPEQVPLLVTMLKDEDPTVRTESARALQRLHNPVAIDPLLLAVNRDKEPEAGGSPGGRQCSGAVRGEPGCRTTHRGVAGREPVGGYDRSKLAADVDRSGLWAGHHRVAQLVRPFERRVRGPERVRVPGVLAEQALVRAPAAGAGATQ